MRPPFPQIGSYFGSEIAPLDIDGDGVTDNLLVAAPMFFSGGLEKGKVYIYRVTELVSRTCKNKQWERRSMPISFGTRVTLLRRNWVNTCSNSRLHTANFKHTSQLGVSGNTHPQADSVAFQPGS